MGIIKCYSLGKIRPSNGDAWYLTVSLLDYPSNNYSIHQENLKPLLHLQVPAPPQDFLIYLPPIDIYLRLSTWCGHGLLLPGRFGNQQLGPMMDVLEGSKSSRAREKGKCILADVDDESRPDGAKRPDCGVQLRWPTCQLFTSRMRRRWRRPRFGRRRGSFAFFRTMISNLRGFVGCFFGEYDTLSR